MRYVLLSLLLLGLSGCSIVYKLPTRQGNVIQQDQLDKVQIGMTRDQVKFLLGTPIATSPFRTERWDYFGYYKSPRGDVSTRTVSFYFDDNKLARMDGAQLPGAATAKDVGTPDVDTLAKEVQKDENEKSRNKGKDKDTGIAVH